MAGLEKKGALLKKKTRWWNNKENWKTLKWAKQTFVLGKISNLK